MWELWLIPHFIHVWHRQISQTLIASTIGTVLFLIFTMIYVISKYRDQHSFFGNTVDMTIESVMKYLKDVWGDHVWWWAIVFTTGIFFYVLRSNVVGLLWDMVVLAVPAWHAYFRPAWSDVMFNAALAILWVWWSIFYGFYTKGRHHIEHYIPYRGIGIVPAVNSIGTGIARAGDILIWLLIGFIELMGELGRVTSLSLRLFGNVFVGIILLWLITQAANTFFFDTPFLLPLTIFAYELIVAGLQAFLFSLLVTVYFRIASDHH